MTAAECMMMTGAFVFLCGMAGLVSTVSVALCNRLEARDQKSMRRR